MTPKKTLSIFILVAFIMIAAGIGDNRAGALLAQGIGAADYTTTVKVLKRKAVALDAKFRSTNDCAFIRQQRTIIDAIIILANGENDTALVKEMLNKKEALPAKCASPIGAESAGFVALRVTGALTGEGAGGGCSTGLIAELMSLERSARANYVEAAGLDVDIDVLNAADYLILDLSDGGMMPNLGANTTYLETQCPDDPGVNGMILSYYLMNDSERRDWTTSIPFSIAEQVNVWLPATQQIQMPLQISPTFPVLPDSLLTPHESEWLWQYKERRYLP